MKNSFTKSVLVFAVTLALCPAAAWSENPFRIGEEGVKAWRELHAAQEAAKAAKAAREAEEAARAARQVETAPRASAAVNREVQDLSRQIDGSLRGGFNRTAKNPAPDYVVTSRGITYPVPAGANGPIPVINKAGKQTGSAFVGGKGGTNKQVAEMRLMAKTPPRGKDPGAPNGYIKYENRFGQGVDPYSGKTLPQPTAHFPIDKK